MGEENSTRKNCGIEQRIMGDSENCVNELHETGNFLRNTQNCERKIGLCDRQGVMSKIRKLKGARNCRRHTELGKRQ